MIMKHIAQANSYPASIQEAAKRQTPQQWAERASRYADRGLTLASGFCAIASIAARGHWTLINGHWYRNGL
jgi:hypothetical protein